MKPLLLLSALTLFPLTIMAEPFPAIPLWPSGVPGEIELKLPDESVEQKGLYNIDIRSNVSTPTLTVYPAPVPTGTAVLVFPGGGYNILADSHEGTEVCEWLTTLGITAGLVKYRVPRRDGLEKHEAPLADAQRAIALMRKNFGRWGIDPKQVGVLGFSAGGHLATMTLTATAPYEDPKKGQLDGTDVTPNFGILMYPAYLLDETNPDELSAEIKITETTPPLFIAVADDDDKYVEGSARLYIEMRRNDRPCELHIFAKGGHGFGFAATEERIKSWPALAASWLDSMKLR